MGYSIGKVFRPIEEEMKKYCDVDNVFMPIPNYSLIGLYRNIKAAKKAISKADYDIVHITGTEHYLIPFISGPKVVVTVHDIGSLISKKNIINSKLKKLFFINSLTKANALTFISSKTKEECKELLNLDVNRCVVINNPTDPIFTYDAKEFNNQTPIVLHIGTKANKNLDRTIEALKDLNVHLRIVGKLNDGQKELLEASGILYSNVWDLTDDEIINEYKSCDIVSFPSLYEGFGMPIIEGQSIGRVVVTSDLEPMKYISNDSAILVNPTDVLSMRRGYMEAIKNHNDYINMGLKNVHRFSLKTIVSQYYKLYWELSNT